MAASEQWLKTCPLCGGDNQCAMAAGQPGEACWCAAATIDTTAVEAIPADAVGTRCICANCSRTTGELSNER